MFSTGLRFAILFVVLCVNASAVVAEDWPNWMGPSNDNRWQAANIIDKFPEGGPKEVWRTPVAGGYAGPAVVGDRLYLTDFKTDQDAKISNFDRRPIDGVERVLCLDASTGDEIWSHSYAVKYAISYPGGPRCTPVVDGERVYTLGAEGNLFCFDRESSDILWSRELKREYSTNSPLWGYSSHPLIDGNKLICVVGGDGSHTVAFDKMSGKELWRYGTASEQGYSPPTIIEHSGVRQLILVSPDFVASVDPESGSEYWTQPYGASNGSIIMTPIHYQDHLFVGGYSNRNLMLQLTGAGTDDGPQAKTVFRDKPKLGLSPVNVQPFLDGDLMIGMDQGGELMAVELPSGKRLWTSGQPLAERPVQTGTAFIVKQGERFFLFAETGELVIAQINREGYQEIDRAKIIEPTNNAFGRPVAWYPPAYASGRIFVRNDEECICVELTQR